MSRGRALPCAHLEQVREDKMELGSAPREQGFLDRTRRMANLGFVTEPSVYCAESDAAAPEGPFQVLNLLW